MPKTEPTQRKGAPHPARPAANVLGALSFRESPWAGEHFSSADVERAALIYRDGEVRVRLANTSPSSFGVFGWVEDPEPPNDGRVEVSVIAQRHDGGGWTIDGRSTSQSGSHHNDARVAALIIAAQAERGGDAGREEVDALLATIGAAPAVRLSRSDVRAGVLNWDEGNVLGDLRLATLVRDDADIDGVLRGVGLRPIEEIHPFDEIGPEAIGSYASPAETADGQERAWAEFYANAIPAIEAFGETVAGDTGIGIEVIQSEDPQGAWHDDDDDMDWFGFEYGVQLGRERVNILPDLSDYLRSRPAAFCLAELASKPKGHKVPVKRRGGGGYLAIEASRLHGVLQMLAELLSDKNFDPDNGQLKVHRLHAAQIAASKEGKAFVKAAPPSLLEMADALGAPPPRDEKLPQGFLADLRPYQTDGVNWLAFLRQQEMGGILADDMGLGKTIQTLCHLHREKASGRADRPTLIVAPKSVAPNWEAEAKKFAPSLNVLRLEGARRKRYYEVLKHSDLVIVSYPVLLRDAEELLAQKFHYVVLDEAHTIKNSNAQITKVAYDLDSRHRLALSGTPIENHLGELWSLFHFLMPGYLGNEPSFTERFRIPIEKMRDGATMERLAERVRPLMLRRTKDLVAKDLPEKTEMLRTVELAPDQVDLYEAVRAGISRDLAEEIERRGMNASKILILDALLKLRQVCCHPALLKLPSARKAKRSAKLDRLMEMVPTMVEEGRRILIFSQFTSMIELIEDALTEAGIKHQSLTGSSKDRKGLCDRFQAGEVPVFLISLRAGGTGITLTAADTVIHYDPWWNPALEAQATDRAHRIGQKNPVFVYKMITRGTIEEKIVMLQQKKRALFEGLLEGAPQKLEFSEAELENLLAPVGA